jgi:hypothetical protein
MISMRIHLLTAAVALVLAAPAIAADTAVMNTPKPTPMLVRGTIQIFDGKTLTIKTLKGDTITGAMTPQTRLSAVEARTFEQLKPTDFVGITAHDGPNGHLVAEEVHIIPIAGIGEGQYPWDHHPEGATEGPVRAGSMTNGTIVAPSAMHAGSMTNGTIEAPAAMHAGSMTNGTVTSGDKHELKVTFHGSQIVDGKCVGHAAPGGTGCVGSAIADVTSKTYIQAIVGAKPEDLKVGLAVVGSTLTAPDGSVVIASMTVEKNGVKPAF